MPTSRMAPSRRGILPAAALLVCLVRSIAQCQNLEQLESKWSAVNRNPSAQGFNALIPQLLGQRNRPDGKTWQINYMLGSSYCRIPGQQEKGRAVLRRVLAAYGLPDGARSSAEQAISNCGRMPMTGAQTPSFDFVTASGQTGSILRGKGGYEVDTRENSASNKVQPSSISAGDLRKRRFNLGDEPAALNAAMARVDDGFRGAVRDGFVVVSHGEMPAELTGDCLARYRPALMAQFEMQPPDELITVYVVHEDELSSYAARLHGVVLPFGTVAYSIYEDLSIVGIAAYEACGSLAHELVHLSIRRSFGDCPPWLEEGIASEVAVSSPSPSGFHFPASWRDDVLHRHWQARPSISQLLDYTWADLGISSAGLNSLSSVNTSRTSDVTRVATIHAFAASFVRFLQDRKVLGLVYIAIRDGMSSSNFVLSDQQILERTFKKSIGQIDSDFVQWFDTTTSLRPRQH